MPNWSKTNLKYIQSSLFEIRRRHIFINFLRQLLHKKQLPHPTAIRGLHFHKIGISAHKTSTFGNEVTGDKNHFCTNL